MVEVSYTPWLRQLWRFIIPHALWALDMINPTATNTLVYNLYICTQSIPVHPLFKFKLCLPCIVYSLPLNCLVAISILLHNHQL